MAKCRRRDEYTRKSLNLNALYSFRFSQPHPRILKTSLTFCWHLPQFRGILTGEFLSPDAEMSDLKTILPKMDHPWEPEPERQNVPQDRRQWKLMASSLLLLLLALAIVLWHDRDFWFPDQPDSDSDDSADVSPITNPVPMQPLAGTAKPAKKPKHLIAEKKPAAPPIAAATTAPAAATTTTRTVLPPLEVEVVAGDTHRTVRPGSSSVRVDLQPGTPPQPVADAGVASDTETAANVTSNAAERVQISTDASQIVTRPVTPDYPLLARQMKVQGSVILQALIGRDGIIQNLRVVSGPQILASAAEDAVRQWHFKPHFQGSEAVETEAKITVNFTISTN
jgi:periplasmic protein TonB